MGRPTPFRQPLDRSHGGLAQPQKYRDSVLPPKVSARVAVEAGIAQSWYKFVPGGEIVSLEHYGASADDKTLSLTGKRFG